MHRTAAVSADARIGEGKTAAGEAVAAEHRAAGRRRRAGGAGAAVVGLGDVAGAEGDRRGGDGQGMCAAGEGVVAGLAANDLAAAGAVAKGEPPRITECHRLAGADVLAGHGAGAGQRQALGDARERHVVGAVMVAEGGVGGGGRAVIDAAVRQADDVGGDAGGMGAAGEGVVACRRVGATYQRQADERDRLVVAGVGAAHRAAAAQGQGFAADQRAQGEDAAGDAVAGVVLARTGQADHIRGDGHLLGGPQGVVGGQAAAAAVGEAQAGDAEALAGAGVGVGHAGRTGEDRGFAADVTDHGEQAGGQGGAAVVGARTGQGERLRADGGGGVGHVGHGVVAAAVAVADRGAADRDRLVAAAGVLVGEGEAAAGDRVAGKYRATADHQAGRGGDAAARGCGAAVVGLDHASGGQGDGGRADGGGVGAAGQGVVAGKPPSAVGQGQVGGGHGLVDADILVGHCADAGPGQGERFALDQIVQGEEAGQQRRGAVVRAAAGEADHPLGDDAGGVADRGHRIVAGIGAVTHQQAADADGPAAAGGGGIEGVGATGDAVAAEHGAAGDADAAGGAGAAVVGLGHGADREGEGGLAECGGMGAADQGVVAGQAGIRIRAVGQGEGA